MTSQMNFGPEWMRGGEVSKRNFQLDDTSSKNDIQQHNHSINDSHDDSTFKYSKDYMLSLYKSVDLPIDIKHHEYVVTTQGQSPLSLLEDKFLDNDTTMNGLNFKSDKSFALENLNGKSNLLPNGNDGFEFSNNLRRGSELEDEPIWSGVDKDNVGTFDSNGVFHLDGGDSNLGDTSLESSLEPEEADNFNFDLRDLNIPFSTLDKNDNQMNKYSLHFENNSLMTPKTTAAESKTSYRWVYRDPSGNVQGPFMSLEMQEWFEAGFFDHSLNVKREDAPFFEPLSALIHKVQNVKAPFSAPWPKEPSSHQRQQSNTDFERTQVSPPPKTTNNFASALLFDNELGNRTLDQLPPHLDNTLDAFNYSGDFGAKSNLGVAQSPFGKSPFSISPLPRLNPTMNRTQLPSPWENSNTQNGSSSWLSNRNDPLYNSSTSYQQQPSSRNLQHHDNLLYDRTENDFGAGAFANLSQQQAMSQQMEQQYLNMLRQNQQQHIQLQQRMLQEQQHQQQQQLLMQQQQQQRQQEQFLLNKQNYDQHQQQQRNAAPLPAPLSLHKSFMNRGWTSVPSTPGSVEPLQSPWNVTKFSNEPFNPPFQPPPQSQSPPTDINTESQEQQSKTLVEEPNDLLADTLNDLSINDIKPAFVEEPRGLEPPIQKATPPLKQKEEPKQKQSKRESSTSNTPAWAPTAAKKKALREIQKEEEVSSSKKAPQPRSNTWSSVSAANKPAQQQQQRAAPVVNPSLSTNTRGHQTKSNAWETPVRQKRVSMNASIPSSSVSSALSRTHASSRHPTIKSEPKGPSEEFLTWCKLSLRGLNAGVKIDEILQMLLSFPVDNSYSEIIQDIIYANSSSMNGSRFASDFITRRKADLDGKLNVVLPKSSSINNNGSSEFKVVTKKGKKKHHH